MERSFYSIVMVALVATIHDFLRFRQKKTWMVGLKPTMTTE